MDLKDIRALTKILNSSGLSVIEICEGDNKIRLEKQTLPQPSAFFPAAPPSEKNAMIPFPDEPAGINMSSGNDAVDFNNVTELRSPIIGIFYAAASPADKPFVEIGSKVKKGDTVCIIEAMKIMNEIPADRDGEIVDICVQNGQVVEYSQVLFKIF